MSRKSSKRKRKDDESTSLFPFGPVSDDVEEVKESDEQEELDEEEFKEETAAESSLASMPSASERVLVRSLWPARLVVKADVTPSGETYVWPKAGAEILVNETDVSFLLSRNKPGREGSGCCGGDGRRTYFEVV